MAQMLPLGILHTLKVLKIIDSALDTIPAKTTRNRLKATAQTMYELLYFSNNPTLTYDTQMKLTRRAQAILENKPFDPSSPFRSVEINPSDTQHQQTESTDFTREIQKLDTLFDSLIEKEKTALEKYNAEAKNIKAHQEAILKYKKDLLVAQRKAFIEREKKLPRQNIIQLDLRKENSSRPITDMRDITRFK